MLKHQFYLLHLLLIPLYHFVRYKRLLPTVLVLFEHCVYPLLRGLLVLAVPRAVGVHLLPQLLQDQLLVVLGAGEAKRLAGVVVFVILVEALMLDELVVGLNVGERSGLEGIGVS